MECFSLRPLTPRGYGDCGFVNHALDIPLPPRDTGDLDWGEAGAGYEGLILGSG